MADVYKKLAKKLDRMPNGFPPTPSGVELKLLRKIFSPEDARLALKIPPMPATAEQIAKRFRKPVAEVRPVLDGMAGRGQIGSMKMDGVQKYVFMPFVVGIYEFQLDRLDKELADLCEEYFPFFMPALGANKPALARVVPVNASIDARAEILAYEDMRGLIRESRSFVLRECICRKEKALEGQPCSHTLETCLEFSVEENAHDYFSYSGRIIGKGEALRLLDQTEEEGLVHATYNVRERPMFVCNCCSCCCGFLRGLKEFHAPYVIARSSFMASIDPETCEDCGVCESERCPVDAIRAENGSYTVSEERCIGCGACAVACPSDSIRLVPRAAAECAVPPKDVMHWAVERASDRGGALTKLALRMWLARRKRLEEKQQVKA